MKKYQLELPGRLLWGFSSLDEAEKWGLRLMAHDLTDAFIHEMETETERLATLRHLHKNGHTCTHCGHTGQVVEVRNPGMPKPERLHCHACGKRTH